MKPFAEHVQELRDEEASRIKEAMEKAGDAKAVCLTAPDGRFMIVTPSITHPGQWQLTWFTAAGDPWGHSNMPTRDEAIQSAIGVHGNSYGPPHGSREFKVTATLTGKEIDAAWHK